MKNQRIKTGKLQMKAILLTGVLVFESIFAGIGTVNAQTVSENGITAEESTSLDVSVSENAPEQEVIPDTKMSGPQEEDVAAERAAIKYSGTDGAVNWSIDENGHLLLTGDGDYEGDPDWLEHYLNIKSAVVKVKNMTRTTKMFEDCHYISEVNISELDTSNVTDMSYMFAGCNSLLEINFGEFDTSKVSNMSYMFAKCGSLVNLDLSNFHTSKVTDMSGMFSGCVGLKNLDISSFDTSQVTDMSSMFGVCRQNGYRTRGCQSLVNLDLSNFNTSKVTDMSGMFEDCYNLTSVDVSGFDTSNVTNMEYLFSFCRKLKSLDVKNFDTSNVTNMGYMFEYCENLTDIDVSHFSTSKVTDTSMMFYACEHIVELDFGMWDLSSLEDSNGMIIEMDRLVKVRFPNIPVDTWLSEMCYDENNVLTNMVPANQGTMLYVLAEYADSYCGKNGHTYCLPIFIWAEDWTSAELYLECIREDCAFDVDDKYLQMKTIVTMETIQPTTEKNGETIYTATAVYKGKTYIDKKSVTIPKLPVQSTAKPEESYVKPVGTTMNVLTNFYRVTKAGKTPEVAYMGPKNKKVKKVTIPSTVKIGGVTYKVSSVAPGALKNYKKLTKVTVGKNITKIGKNAFDGCKKLKTIVIKTKKLKSVEKNVFKGIKKNATIDVPNSKKKAYKKLLKEKTGYKKTMTVK